jgi:hypothetical protein
VAPGRSPNYSDPRLDRGLKQLIVALGKRYDGNPRVGFIELGLLGFWGEWQTQPFPNLFAPLAVQRSVLDAFQGAFHGTQLLARYATGPAGEQTFTGYHDDYFPLDTEANPYRDDPRYLFLPQLHAAGRARSWMTTPISGEMVPGGARRFLGHDWPMTIAAAQHAHFSWIGPYTPLAVPLRGARLKRAETLARVLGYNFRLDAFAYSQRAAAGASTTVTLGGTNTGVAPFYYAWPFEFAWIDGNGAVVKRVPAPADIRAWLPGSFSVTAALTAPETPGSYRIAAGIISPLSEEPEIHFANTLDTSRGWTILGAVTVQ